MSCDRYSFISDTNQIQELCSEHNSMSQAEDIIEMYSSTDTLQSIENKLEKCINEIGSLRSENKELKESIKHFEETNSKIQTRLLTEIIGIKRLVQNGDHSPRMKSIIPKKPFSLLSEFLKFEKEIEASEENFEKLENEIFANNLNEPSKFVRLVWKQLVTDEVACSLTWKGALNKTPLKCLAITAAFKSAYCRKFNNEVEFKNTTAKWFQTANDRLKYYARKKTAEIFILPTENP